MTENIRTDSVRTRRRIQTRSRLVRAAVEVFAEQGIVASTVEQICERAGFSRGAFYSNFDSKNAVCAEIIADETQFYVEAMRRGGAAALGHFGANPDDLRLPPYEVIEKVAEHVLRPFIAVDDDQRAASPGNLGLLYAELGLYAAREPELRAAYNAYADGMVTALEQILVPLAAITGLRFRGSARQASEMILSLYEAATRRALVEADPSRVIETIAPDVLLAFRIVTEPDRSGAVDEAARPPRSATA